MDVVGKLEVGDTAQECFLLRCRGLVTWESVVVAMRKFAEGLGSRG